MTQSRRQTDTCEFHQLYLQNDHAEFDYPIFFEDGMDASECSLYYEAIDSQPNGSSRHNIVKRMRVRPRVLREPRIDEGAKGPAPILRRKKTQHCKREQSRLKGARRCSFGGSLQSDEGDQLRHCGLSRSDSSTSVVDWIPQVSFQECVHVITIHPISALPREVRSSIWMSRKEYAMARKNAYHANSDQTKRDVFIGRVRGGPCRDHGGRCPVAA